MVKVLKSTDGLDVYVIGEFMGLSDDPSDTVFEVEVDGQMLHYCIPGIHTEEDMQEALDTGIHDEGLYDCLEMAMA